ncbi:hypothetical protein [Denitratisoma oestradiolicum]|uniref:Uncharacterized protein n=1 Tax=Denitratisoma oestradiolicum TaxID=311182 RepID=A0A6S6YBC2_9PROT|nr:hypothetical protein [Denitratisoma oestradiolicum]TWO79092.1 hypothetical protein CBW56_16600 [Denitratisoma oestradiolicum]CAB1369916.1 conserved protein of unknown function [Denitratisoma oestradiolicum]
MTHRPRTLPKTPGAPRGYALVLVLTLITLGMLYAVVNQGDPRRLGLVRGDRTQRALVQARAALLGYATTYRDQHPKQVFGYLPCPDLDGDGYAEGSCGRAGEAVVGLLPHKTLRLPEALDEANGRLWYIVAGGFKNNPPTTPMNWDTRGAIALMDGLGHSLTDPEDADGGAAAVLVAANAPLPTPVFGSADAPCGSLPSTACAIVDGTLHAQPGDDAHPARWLALKPREIFASITRRQDFWNLPEAVPTGQLNTLIDMAQKAIETRIGNDLAANTPAGAPVSARPAQQGAYGQYTGKWIGEPPTLAALKDDNYTAYWKNWSDQFRYVICSDLRPATPCLAIAGRQCRGALLFSGRSVDGGPRPTRQQPPVASTSRNAYLPNYFESDGALPMLDSTAMSFVGASHYAAARPSADLGRCLVPGSFVSSARDMGSVIVQVSSPELPEATLQVAAATATLGNALSTQSGSGCVWYPTALPFQSRMSAYFRFRIDDPGEGFVFVVADAANNSPAAGTLCGDTTGAHLGYAGTGIAPPKFGLEIDTRSEAASNDPAVDHMAFVYWGSAASSNDDNIHNAGTLGSDIEPINPRNLLVSPPGIATVKSSDSHLPYSGALPLSTDIHVRIDARKHRDAAATLTRLSLKAYVSTVFGAEAATASYQPTCGVDAFRNLALPLDELCLQKPTIEQIDIPLSDDAINGEALARIVVGFTNGQNAASSGGRQSIAIPFFLFHGQ